MSGVRRAFSSYSAYGWELTMNSSSVCRSSMAAIWMVLIVGGASIAPDGTLFAKDRPAPVDANDPTLRLFQMLDESHGGKLASLYILGDIYTGKDANDQNTDLQHVLLVEYDKTRVFGRLTVHVRSVSKLAPEQLKTYTLKQIYDFGVDDTEKFVKTEPGQLGRPGDLYVAATPDGRLLSAPPTDETRKHYDFFLTQYVIPAVQKGGDTAAALVKHEAPQ